MAELSSSPNGKEKFLIVDVAADSASALFLDFDERRELILKKEYVQIHVLPLQFFLLLLLLLLLHLLHKFQ